METVNPLIFQFREPIAGEDFVAGVTIRGPVVAVHEDDGEWWFYGVAPSALAEGGATVSEAFARMLLAIRTLLMDSAMAASSFEEFKAIAERFVGQEDEVERARWQVALDALRSGATLPDAAFDHLPRAEFGKIKCGITVERLDRQEPTESAVQEDYSSGLEVFESAA
jgi:hypothetical protein